MPVTRAARGVGVLRFDFTGIGESEGELGAGLGSDMADLLAAAAAMKAHGCAPQLLIGHSLGGAAVLAMASRCDSARAVAVIGAPFDAAHVLAQLQPAIDKLVGEARAEVIIGDRGVSVEEIHAVCKM